MLKRGQGLPLETIIIAALAVLVLVIVLLFATGAWSRLMGSEKILEQAATPGQISGFRLGCESACFQAKQLADNSNEWMASDYCTKSLKDNTTTYKCWTTNVSVECSKTFSTATGGTTICSNGSVSGKVCICQ